ncbi:hypothetical protein [Rhizobium laguerreae]|uniref:hypothetical protein n=1 Tax=Rhizobium laguerreae TaxID=1076926 RepID=UPI001C9277CE|nr:hypothetical protein [Rhizobium laguerreae]MBY3123240.1 hypothetical protein [Rhizobium laguerreae]MBY3191548.1 hypothetical protein [Rhizobium laguerreae]
MGHVLAAREYKLLLKSSEFRARPTLQTANDFWTSRVQSVVALIANDPEPFDEAVHRVIRFWDTSDGILSRNDLILRTREEVDENFVSTGKSEMTLKLRMPDQFVVASTFLAANGNGNETKFEEDIGPLEIAASRAGEKTQVIVPVKRSTRNRFSLSTTMKINSQQRLTRLADVLQAFPGVKEIVPNQTLGASLNSGPINYEYAFKKGKAEFANNIGAKFTLSLWCFHSPIGDPDLAELSYTCKTRNGGMPGKAARKAYDLFIELQNRLGDIIDPENTSKTALALPKGCGS